MKFTTKKLEVDINTLAPNAWNPNKQNDAIFDAAKESIKKYGFIQPILVREKDQGYEIIDGEHRWRAAKELGSTRITIENIGQLPEQDAKALTILMNAIKGEDDAIKRGVLFKEFTDQYPELLDLMPFTDDEIEHDIQLIDFDPNDYDDDRPDMNDPKKRYVIFKFDVDIDDAPMVEKVLRSFDASNDIALVEMCAWIEEQRVNGQDNASV